MRDSNIPKDDRVLRESIDAAFNELSPAEELEEKLDTLHQMFRSDRSHVLPAFEAIQMIAACEWGREDGLERIPMSGVEVPWWVVQALAIGFNRYTDARVNGRITKLGEAYGLEGGGQGKLPRVTQSARELSEQRLAMGIAKREQQGMALHDAIEAVIAETGSSLSFKRVEEIWAKYSAHARAIKYP